MIQLRPACEQDYPRIVDLNRTQERHTGPMSMERFVALERLSSYCKVAVSQGKVAGFLLAFREGTAYDSENYQWFKRELKRFLYIDRIVLDATLTHQGIGSMLYKDLFEFARDTQITLVTCEYNIDPPNLPSRAFHDKFGFKELSTQWVARGTKQVSLQASQVNP